MSVLVTLDQVAVAYGHVPLLDRASLRIDEGERVALIGRNGTGKSTLLKVIAGEAPLDAGRIWRAPGARIARLEQEVPESGQATVRDELRTGLPRTPHGEPWETAHLIDQVVTRLQLPADRPLGELSGGWRRRVLLGKALVAQPDLLLLDEPTNHLDIDAIRWLEDHLLEFPGALLFVTHDRTFLRRLATRIVDLDRGQLTSWPGDYDTYLTKKEAALETEARDLARLDKRLAQEEAWLRRGIKARRTRNEGRVRALLDLRAERAAYRAPTGTVRLQAGMAAAPGRLVFEADRVSKRFDGVPVIADASFRILRGDRVGFIGPNGSGKTTLVRLLVGDLEPDTGEVRRGARVEIAYFDQQRDQLDPGATVAESVSEGDTVTINGESRHVLGYLADFLFPRERALSPVRSLSGGERNRLLLARLFARPANVLVLDEPTNDLDIETLELLEELIASFDGTVLIVTHDRAFLDDVVTSTIALEADGRVSEYVGGYEDYLRQSRTTGSQPAESGDTPVSASVRSARPRPRKRTFNEDREHRELPGRIEALEQERARLTAEVSAPDFYQTGRAHIESVLARIDAIGPELEGAMERWVELEDLGQ